MDVTYVGERKGSKVNDGKGYAMAEQADGKEVEQVKERVGEQRRGRLGGNENLLAAPPPQSSYFSASLQR